MNLLSIMESITSIATVAASTARAFEKLRELCNPLPGRLHALGNEISDIELILHQVALLVEQHTGRTPLEGQQAHILHLLDQAGPRLEEMRLIIDTLIGFAKTAETSIFRTHAWRENQPRLRALQEDIKTIKCSLNIMLGASDSRDMMRFQVSLDTITTSSSNPAQSQLNTRQNLHTSLVRHQDNLTDRSPRMYKRVGQRIADVEELLKVQAARMQDRQLDQLGTLYGHRSPYPGLLPPNRKHTQHLSSGSSDGVGMRVTQRGACRPGCPCNCHSHSRVSTPGLVDRVFGQMFVGYAGLPFVNIKCDTDSCGKSQAANISVEYWFPPGFAWSNILRFELTYQARIGPHFGLSTLRRVPDSAQCVKFALNGNIDGLKDLFRRNRASPRDVSNTRGYSVLRWAMYGKQYQTCKFLLNAGADPDYRPIAASDNSPRNRAHQFLLMGGLTDDDAEALRCLTRGDDFIDEQSYTTLHKIILGLSMADLEEEIRLRPEDINTTDVMGRTPLAWAACRGDDRAIVTLLSHGANVNTLDVQHSGVLGHAADRNYVTCVRLLLEAGADPDIASAHGFKVGNPLNVAARNASDPLVPKTLLDFGASVDSCGIDGMTALIHASRKDNVSFATLLLEHGANINAASAAGQTPLTTAVAYNSHNVLRLLLDRWFEYSDYPRLTGPHLLQTAALYADIETITILTDTNFFRLEYDSSYTLSQAMGCLNERPDVTDKLVFAFDGLIDTFKRDSPSFGHHDTLSLMESGSASLDASISDSEVFERISNPHYVYIS